MLARVCAGLAAGTQHRYLQPPLSGCRCPRLPVCAGCTHKHQGCLQGGLRHRAWLPAAPLCVPLPSKAHPTLLLVQTEAASGFPPPCGSTQPTALRLQVAVSSASSTARPGTLLGRRVTCVSSVNSLRPFLLLPGASCSPVHRVFPVSGSLGAGRGGWSQHSSASDRDGAQLSISSHYQRPAQRFLKESCRCPLPPCFLCPVVEVFSKSVVFSMQINYFKNCFCKYLCEYFSIVFDNLQHFHDLVIAFAGVFKMP